MNILAIDTTTRIASVSILSNNKIFNNFVDNEITHSEKLLPLVDKTLKETGIALKDIDMFACINGPGSFTGIRIGLSTLKAFAQVYKKDIFSISSLSLISYSTYLKEKKDILYSINLIDARNDRVYYNLTKLYKDNDKIIIDELVQTSNELIEDAIKNLKLFLTNNNIKNNIVISGNIVNKFSDKLSIISTNQYELYPDTNTLIDLVQNIKTIESYTFNSFTLDAMYARQSQAERVKNES